MHAVFHKALSAVQAWGGANRARALWALMALAGAAQADYSSHPEARAFIREMQDQHGLSAEFVRGLLQQARRQDQVLERISRPVEKVLTWKEYRRIFLTEERIRDGRAFLQTHRDSLERARARYGVPPEIIVAILGVETKYGRVQGTFRVIDALATLGFDYPPRSAFFRKELGQFLLMAREQGIDPLAVTGSYAGAMGYGQFIPSSYRHYAVDFDGDGRADLWQNPVDAIGSVANYFRQHGWRADAPVAAPAQVQGEGYRQLLGGGLKPRHDWAELQRQGVRAQVAAKPEEPALLLELEGAGGREFWAAFQNFYVITRYNHSHLYAMAVYQLSQEIAHD